VTARSKAQVCGRSPAEIVGSNPTGGMDVCLCECCLLWDGGLCDWLITPEEFYRLWCVVECDLETSIMRRPWPTGGCRAKKEKEKDWVNMSHHAQWTGIICSRMHSAYRWPCCPVCGEGGGLWLCVSSMERERKILEDPPSSERSPKRTPICFWGHES